MSCPRCGNSVLVALGDDPVGISRCGKCGAMFTAEEAGNLLALNEILDEIKKINARLEMVERRLPQVQLGGCPECGCQYLYDKSDSGLLKDGEAKCMGCGYKFMRR